MNYFRILFSGSDVGGPSLVAFVLNWSQSSSSGGWYCLRSATLKVEGILNSLGRSTNHLCIDVFLQNLTGPKILVFQFGILVSRKSTFPQMCHDKIFLLQINCSPWFVCFFFVFFISFSYVLVYPLVNIFYSSQYFSFLGREAVWALLSMGCWDSLPSTVTKGCCIGIELNVNSAWARNLSHYLGCEPTNK